MARITRSALKINAILILLIFSSIVFQGSINKADDIEISFHTVDPKLNKLRFYWKDENGTPYANFKRLKKSLDLQGRELLFAMNGGMYLTDTSPQGLYIEKGIELKKINKVKNAYGNFYLQPNGVFYLKKDGSAGISKTTEFNATDVNYATQSGPMLLINGAYHPAFRKGSSNVHIRNGVGILPNGEVIFAISKQKINFYDFATFFKKKGCKNALYLDGFVSRMYLPSKDWKQQDGAFAVIIGEVK